jgi:recombination protein RecT
MTNDLQERKSKGELLKDYLHSPEVMGAIKKVLPKFLTTDKLLTIVLGEVRKNPKLLECDQISFVNAIVECTQLGLIPGSLFGQAYLIPFNKSEKRMIDGKEKWTKRLICTLLPGYRGYVTLAERAGTSLVAHAVYENDKYECLLGTEQKILHIPAHEDRGDIRCAYAVAKKQTIDKKTGDKQIITKIDHLSMDDLNKAKSCSKCPEDFWDKWEDEQCRKTAAKRLSKYLDLTPEFSQLNEIDNNLDSGIIIDGDFNVESRQQKKPQGKALADKIKKQKEDQKDQFQKECESIFD